MPKQLKRLMLAGAALLALAAGGEMAVYLLELDMASCYSDNLGPALRWLELYREKKGAYPAEAGELYSFIREENGGPDASALHRFREEFVLFPKGEAEADGAPLLLRCPYGSHGFFWRYAFGASVRGYSRVHALGVSPYRRKKP